MGKTFKRSSDGSEGSYNPKKVVKGKGVESTSEDLELKARNEYLKKSFNPELEIKNAEDKVAEGTDSALKQTPDLMPDNATPIHKAIIERFTPEILAAHAEASEALAVLKNEYDQEVAAEEKLQKDFLDTFRDQCRTELVQKGLDLETLDSQQELYSRALSEARKRVVISDELEDQLGEQVAEIFLEVQGELNPEVEDNSDETVEDGSDDEELKRPQAGNNDLSALAGLRDQLPKNVEPSADSRAKISYDKLNQQERKVRLVSFLRSFATTLQDAFEQKALVSDEQIRDAVIDSLHSIENDSKLSVRAENRLARYLALILQDVRNGEDVSNLDFEGMIEQLPERTDKNSDTYIDFPPRGRSLVDDIFEFSKTQTSHHNRIKQRNLKNETKENLSPEEQFERLFANRLRAELDSMEIDTSDQSLENTYDRVFNTVLDNFNADLPRLDSNFNSDFTIGENYGKYKFKLSRREATEIARKINKDLQQKWRQEKTSNDDNSTKEIVERVRSVDFTRQGDDNNIDKKAPEVEFANTNNRLTENPEHTEARPTGTDIKIDPAKIKPGFTVAWGNGQSAQVTRTTAKTVFYQNPADLNKESKVAINKITAIKDTSGKLVMGEGAREMDTEAPSPLLDPEGLDRLMAEAIGENKAVDGDATENNANKETSPEDILHKMDEIEVGVKLKIDVNVKNVEDSTALREFLETFKIDLETADIDDLKNRMSKLEILQLVLQEYVEGEKTFAYREFLDSYTERLKGASPFRSKEPKKDKIIPKEIFFRDPNEQRIAKEYTELIEQAKNFDELYKALDKIGSLKYSNGSTVNASDLKEAIEDIRRVAQARTDDPKYSGPIISQSRLQRITRNYGLRDKVIKLLDTEFPVNKEASPVVPPTEVPVSGVIEAELLEVNKIEDIIEKIRTIPFTDAAGKEVELKVGDKLYLIIPEEKQIETYVIEDLDTDNGSYLSDGNWYELHSDYYSDIDDAEKNVAQLGVDAENNTPDYQPEFNLDSANSVADKIRIINDRIQKFTEEEKLAHKDVLKALGDITDKWMDLRQQLLHDLAGIPAAELDLDLRELEEDIDQIASLLAIDFPVKQSNENIDIPKLEESLPADEEARISEHAELLKIQEEFEKLSPEEQKKVSWGIHNIGFVAKKKKSELFAKYLRVSSDNSNTTTLGRFMNSLADTYAHDAENAQRLIELAEERKKSGSKFGLVKSGAMSFATTIGMLAKAGRTVSDLTGASLVSPLRYVMMGSMAAARGFEAGKETRVSLLAEKNPNIIHQTDWEKLIENWIKYQDEFASENKTEEELLEGFRTAAVVRDLEQRFNKAQEADKVLGIAQNILQSDVLYTIDKIKKRITDIDQDAGLQTDQKIKEKSLVLKKYAQHIKSLEHIVDQYGKVDVLAAMLKYAEKGSKAAVMAMTVETLMLSAEAFSRSIAEITQKNHELIGSIEYSITQRVDSPSGDLAPVSGSTFNTGEILTTPTEAPSIHGAGQVVETVSTSPAPTEVTPVPSINPVEDFTKDHLLYKETGAEITNGANGVKVEYEIGGAKGDFATLDQALRRVVAQEISIDPNGKFNAVEATRAENVLANLRQLLEGKAVGDIKPTELDGIAEFKDGKLTILNYQKFDDFMDGKLFARATENIAEANVATGYSQTSASKWQEIFDQRAEKTTVDFGSSTDAKVPEVAESTATDATAGANPEVPSPAAPVETTTPTEAPIDSDTITETLNKQTPETVGGNSSVVDVKPRSLQEVASDVTPYPAEYMGDVLGKMPSDQAQALAEVMREAKIDADKWERINFIIEGNTELLQNADGKFDSNQVELALELSNVRLPKPAELRLALEAMQVIDLEEAQEAAIVQAIMNPKEGPKMLEKLFGDSSGNRGAKVTLNPRKGILHFENLGPQKLDGNMNFREGVLRIGKRAGAIFGGKFPLKNLVQAINSFK